MNKCKPAWTFNQDYDNNGYFPVENLWDPKELSSEVPEKKGQYTYTPLGTYNHVPVENQVEGSTARYWHPQYKKIHNSIRLKIEKIIGRKLYNTYYYDRFYFPGQELKKHTDRDACEISVSVHVGTNLKNEDAEWPFCIKTPDGEAKAISLEPGDGVLYKGCECEHWRAPMPTPKRRKRDIILRRPKVEYYYHQIFFHYVLQDGYRAHCAWDKSR